MSDSLTRLILRAQGRPPARPATAEPLLASRYESGFGLAPVEAEPWIADEIDAHPAGRRMDGSSHPAGSPRDARTSDGRSFDARAFDARGFDERAAIDPGGRADDGAGATPDTATRASGSTHGIAGDLGQARVDRGDPPVRPERSPVGRHDGDEPALRPRRSTSPSRAAEVTADPRDALPQTGGDGLRSRSAVEVVPLAGAAASPAGRAQFDPMGERTAQTRDRPSPAPEVRITIGMVEVHAVPPRPAPQRPNTARRPGTSLAEYLGRRAGRS